MSPAGCLSFIVRQYHESNSRQRLRFHWRGGGYWAGIRYRRFHSDPIIPLCFAEKVEASGLHPWWSGIGCRNLLSVSFIRNDLGVQESVPRRFPAVSRPFVAQPASHASYAYGKSCTTISKQECRKTMKAESDRRPNQALQTTPMTRSVFEKTIEFGHPQRGV